jgi:hypothetical protein
MEDDLDRLLVVSFLDLGQGRSGASIRRRGRVQDASRPKLAREHRVDLS